MLTGDMQADFADFAAYLGPRVGKRLRTGQPHPAHAPANMNTQAVRDYLLDLQLRIVTALEAVDGNPFLSDGWTRDPRRPA